MQAKLSHSGLRSQLSFCLTGWLRLARESRWSLDRRLTPFRLLASAEGSRACIHGSMACSPAQCQLSCSLADHSCSFVMLGHTCLMSSLAAPTSPTLMRTGLVSASLTSLSTLLGMVAENSRVCLSGRICPMMDRTCTLAPREIKSYPTTSEGRLHMALHFTHTAQADFTSGEAYWHECPPCA